MKTEHVFRRKKGVVLNSWDRFIIWSAELNINLALLTSADSSPPALWLVRSLSVHRVCEAQALRNAGPRGSLPMDESGWVSGLPCGTGAAEIAARQSFAAMVFLVLCYLGRLPF